MVCFFFFWARQTRKVCLQSLIVNIFTEKILFHRFWELEGSRIWSSYKNTHINWKWIFPVELIETKTGFLWILIKLGQCLDKKDSYFLGNYLWHKFDLVTESLTLIFITFCWTNQNWNRGCIFSCVWPSYERAVSNLDRSMNISLLV
jgi:hypothetical protein